jgi:hypothetical protein
VQLSLGDIAAAQRSFERAEAGAVQAQHAQQAQGEAPRAGAQACSDRGLLLFAQQDFKGEGRRRHVGLGPRRVGRGVVDTPLPCEQCRGW